MKKEWKNLVIFSGALFLVALLILIGLRLQGRIISENILELHFYDNKTNCKLNGKVYLSDNFLGNTENSIYSLSEQEYKDNFKENLTLLLSGETDECFYQDANLSFIEFWTIPNLDNYFKYNRELFLEAKLSPRQPVYYEEMQGFIKPEQAKPHLVKIKKYFSSNIEGNLDRIAKFNIKYRDDFVLFRQAEYWQTPSQTLENGHGDSEDWTITVLSLIKAYNSSLKCYNIVWKTHNTIYCYINKKHIFYDQGNIKHETILKEGEGYLIEQENKVKLRTMRNNYFESYGISPSERKIFALFDEKQVIKFENNEEFIEWQLNLTNE